MYQRSHRTRQQLQQRQCAGSTAGPSTVTTCRPQKTHAAVGHFHPLRSWSSCCRARRPRTRCPRGAGRQTAEVETDQHVKVEPLAHHQLLHVLQHRAPASASSRSRSRVSRGRSRPDTLISSGRLSSPASISAAMPSPTPAAPRRRSPVIRQRPRRPVTRSASPSASSTPTDSTSTAPTATIDVHVRAAVGQLGATRRGRAWSPTGSNRLLDPSVITASGRVTRTTTGSQCRPEIARRRAARCGVRSARPPGDIGAYPASGGSARAPAGGVGLSRCRRRCVRSGRSPNRHSSAGPVRGRPRRGFPGSRRARANPTAPR